MTKRKLIAQQALDILTIGDFNGTSYLSFCEKCKELNIAHAQPVRNIIELLKEIING